MRAALLLLAAAPLAAQTPRNGPGPAPPSQFAWQDTLYLDAIIRLHIDNGPREVMPALSYDTTLLLPVRQLAELAELRVVAMALRDSALLMLEPAHVPIRFKPDQHLLMRGQTRVRYDSLDVAWWDGDLFVATHLLDTLLGTRTNVGWASLTATIGQTASLPVVARGRRERRRELIWTRRPDPAVLDMALQRRLIDGAVASWNVTALKQGPFEQLQLDLGLGGDLFGGSAELRPLLYTADGGSDADLRWSWSRVWTDSKLLSQLRLGDVPSGGLHSRLITGVTATNAPYIRSSTFDIEHLVHDVPAGWEAELYEGGRLLAYSDEDAVGAFRVPLQLGYGQNPYEVVLYGPGGETVRQTRTIRVPFSRLRSGSLEYALAFGRCRYDPCDGVMSADARYGLSSHVTLQGGYDTFFDDALGDLSQPYAVIAAAPFQSLGLTGEAVVNDHLRASAQYEPHVNLRATAAHTRFDADAGRLSGALAEATRSEATLYWRPGLMNGALLFQGAGIVSSGAQSDRRLVRLNAMTRKGLFRYGLGVLSDQLDRAGASGVRRFAIDGSADAFLAGPWKFLRMSTVQGSAAVEPSRGLTAVRAAIGRAVTSVLRLDASVGWLRGSGLRAELSFSTTARGPRMGLRTLVDETAGSQALLYSSGSIAVDPRTRVMRLSDAADLERAGISGVVFQDNNANGRQDAGEPGLRGIPIRVGGWPAETDDAGRFAAWGVFPSEPVQIQIDTLSFTNPQLVLPAPIIRVRPAPNAFGTIVVPVAVGAEISGWVLMDGAPLGGAPLVLRNLDSGAEITTTTYQDGGFYRAAVPPGEWEITLPEALLARLQASAPALSIFVPPGPGEKKFDDLRLMLERQP